MGPEKSGFASGSVWGQSKQITEPMWIRYMGFFTSAVSTLSTMVSAIGAGLGVWGVVNLLEGYGNDNPGAKSQGIKHLMSSMWKDFKEKMHILRR